MDAYVPAHRSIDYVSHKLGVAPDSFYGQLVRLISHADGNNLAILRAAYPRLVRAYVAWMASPDGEFDVPDVESVQSAASCGCEVRPGASWTTGQVRAHFQHTVQAMLLWLLLHHRQWESPTDTERELKLRLNEMYNGFLAALVEWHPGADEPDGTVVRP